MGWSCQRKHTSGPSLTKTSCGLLLTSLFHAETVILTLCSHILDFCDTLIADVMTSWMSIPPASKHGTWIQAGISMRIYNLVAYHVIIEIDWKSLSLELQVRSLKPWPANPKTYFNIFHCIIIGFAANWIKMTRLFRNRWSSFEMSYYQHICLGFKSTRSPVVAPRILTCDSMIQGMNEANIPHGVTIQGDLGTPHPRQMCWQCILPHPYSSPRSDIWFSMKGKIWFSVGCLTCLLRFAACIKNHCNVSSWDQEMCELVCMMMMGVLACKTQALWSETFPWSTVHELLWWGFLSSTKLSPMSRLTHEYCCATSCCTREVNYKCQRL